MLWISTSFWFFACASWATFRNSAVSSACNLSLSRFSESYFRFSSSNWRDNWSCDSLTAVLLASSRSFACSLSLFTWSCVASTNLALDRSIFSVSILCSSNNLLVVSLVSVSLLPASVTTVCCVEILSNNLSLSLFASSNCACSCSLFSLSLSIFAWFNWSLNLCNSASLLRDFSFNASSSAFAWELSCCAVLESNAALAILSTVSELFTIAVNRFLFASFIDSIASFWRFNWWRWKSVKFDNSFILSLTSFDKPSNIVANAPLKSSMVTAWRATCCANISFLDFSKPFVNFTSNSSDNLLNLPSIPADSSSTFDSRGCNRAVIWSNNPGNILSMFSFKPVISWRNCWLWEVIVPNNCCWFW